MYAQVAQALLLYDGLHSHPLCSQPVPEPIFPFSTFTNSHKVNPAADIAIVISLRPSYAHYIVAWPGQAWLIIVAAVNISRTSCSTS